MKNITLEKISKIVFIGAIFYSFVAGTLIFMDTQAKWKAQYAQEHNCVWKYNDMCYSVGSYYANTLQD